MTVNTTPPPEVSRPAGAKKADTRSIPFPAMGGNHFEAVRREVPPAGCGLRNVYAIRYAAAAKSAGYSEAEAIDLWQADCGDRNPGKATREMARAYRNAREQVVGHSVLPPTPIRRRRTVDYERFRSDTLAQYPPEDAAAELWERSPIRLDGDPAADIVLALRTLYDPDDLLFIGTWFDTDTIRTAKDWITAFEKGAVPAEHIVVNPLDGELHPCTTGKATRRCDAAVKAFRYACVEFDDRPIGEQAAFVLHILDRGWPVAAVIHSGSKSLHCWLRVDAADAATWTRDVERRLFGLLAKLGADPNTKNESRLSRTPGALRPGTEKRQALLYLDGGAHGCR